MNKYSMSYNYHIIGDILMIIFNHKEKPTHHTKNGDVVGIYHNEELIGINIFDFSNICKIKSEGLITLPPKELIDAINSKLLNAGFEKLEYINESGFKIGKVLTCEEHPDSDHLHVLTVDIGNEILDIVCGAPNVEEGQKVVVATPYTTMFDGSEIIPSELRGIKSNGMLCSPRELHLENAPAKRGILVLEDDAEVGSDFFLRG